MVIRSRLNAPLFSLALLVGCNAMFDIEEGTLVEGEAGDAGVGGSSATGGKGGAGGKGGSTGGKGGTSGAGTGGDGGTSGTTTGGNGGSSASGGTSATGGNGGSTSGTGGGGSGGTSGGGAAGGAGTGAVAGSDGIPALEDCTCDSGSADPDPNLVQDFENRNAAVLPRSGRDGGFYTYPPERLPAAALECTGQAGNCVALCVSGELDGSGYPWAGLGFTLSRANDMPAPYDVTSFTGISFNVKGNVPTGATLRVDFTTVATASDFGGSCMPTQLLQCNDHYKSGALAPPTDTVEPREVRFVNIGQGNGGGQWTAPWNDSIAASWDPEHALDVNFQVSSTTESISQAHYDFCIDDIKLLGPEARTAEQRYGFETDTEVALFGDVGGTTGTTSVTRDIVTKTEGDSALAAHLSAAEAGETACGGTPEDATPTCAELDATACSATPGCFVAKLERFSMAEPPIEPGDTVGTWFYLPAGEIYWINVFTLSGGMPWTWSSVPLTMPAHRGKWFYGEFSVPATVDPDIHRFGFQLATSPTFSGTMYLDDMTVYRPE